MPSKTINQYAEKWHGRLYNMSTPEQELAMSIAKDCISLGAEVVSLARVEELCPETTTDYKAFEDAKDCYTDYNALRNIIFTKAIECLYKDDIRSVPTLFWFDRAISRLSELTSEDVNNDAEGDDENPEEHRRRERNPEESGSTEHRGGFNNKLPYGLCAKVGITVPEGTVYGDAWKLFTNKTGITEEEAIKQLQENGEVNVNGKSGEQNPAIPEEPKQSKQSVFESLKQEGEKLKGVEGQPYLDGAQKHIEKIANTCDDITNLLYGDDGKPISSANLSELIPNIYSCYNQVMDYCLNLVKDSPLYKQAEDCLDQIGDVLNAIISLEQAGNNIDKKPPFCTVRMESLLRGG